MRTIPHRHGLHWALACLAMGSACSGPSTSGPGDLPPSGGEPTPDPTIHRGLWVWDATIPGDVGATDALLGFATQHGLDTLFLACDPVGYGQDGAEARYTDFVTQAHSVDIQVFGMSGYGMFTVPCDANLPGQNTCHDEGWAVYEACASSSVGFDGIMDDSEPYSFDSASWTADLQTRARWHLDYLEGIRARIGTLPLHHTIPFWYDDLTPVWEEEGGALQTLDAWIAERVDVVAIMAYRADVDAIIEVASGELENGPVWVGIETVELEHAPQATFFDDGPGAVDAALDGLQSELMDNENLHGLMVHSYAGWSALTRAESRHR